MINNLEFNILWRPDTFQIKIRVIIFHLEELIIPETKHVKALKYITFSCRVHEIVYEFCKSY